MQKIRFKEICFDEKMMPVLKPNPQQQPTGLQLQAHKEKKKRTSKPKTKTGCKTCKIRKVKCDEGRPSCSKCITAQALSQIKPKAPLLPKSTTSPMRDPSPPIILHTPNSFPYANLEDFEYYRYFQTEAATELSGGWDDPLWNRVVLQICLEAPCIQLFALAVAGVVRAKRSKIHGRTRRKRNHIASTH